MYFRFIVLFFTIFTLNGRDHPLNLSKKRTLQVSFHLNKITEIKPSYQIAIWLEKPDGTYVQTLFVSEFLSYGGFTLPGICSDWSKKTDWSKTSKEEFDAVTGATPLSGDINFEFHCSKKKIPKGKYEYMIEVHLIEGFNELYKGQIEIGYKKNESHEIGRAHV